MQPKIKKREWVSSRSIRRRRRRETSWWIWLTVIMSEKGKERMFLLYFFLLLSSSRWATWKVQKWLWKKNFSGHVLLANVRNSKHGTVEKKRITAKKTGWMIFDDVIKNNRCFICFTAEKCLLVHILIITLQNSSSLFHKKPDRMYIWNEIISWFMKLILAKCLRQSNTWFSSFNLDLI